MQFIIPEIRIGIRAVLQLDARRRRRLIDGTVVLVPPYTLAAGLDARAVEVLLRVVVDIREQRVGVEEGDAGARVAAGDEHFKGGLELENGVDGGRGLVHGLGDLRMVGPLVRPVLVVADAVQRVVGVQRRQLQGRRVHQHESPRARLSVQRVQRRVDAARVVGQHFPGDLRVRQERPDAQVVGADPERVDGRVGGQAACWVEGCGWRAVDSGRGHVGQEGRDLVFEHRRERRGDWFEPSASFTQYQSHR